MSWRNERGFGQEILDELIKALQMDQRWLVDDFEGFTWWPGDLAQRVWCETGVFHNSVTTYRLHAETDLIRGSGRAQQFELELERAMDHATMNGLVYDEKADTYKLHSSVFATEDNIVYLKRTSFSAAILQISEAQEVAMMLREKLRALPATSSHPTMGLRPTPDPMLKAADSFFKPQGAHPSRWAGVSEWRETDLAMERESVRFTSDHLTHLTAEFEWNAGPQGTIRLDVNSREPHPKLGNGLHFTLSVPLVMSPERVSHMALELNQFERDNWKRSHMLGSWSCHDGHLAYRMFLPNTIYRPELLPEMTLNMSIRAHWTNEFFVEKRRQAEEMRSSHSG